MKLQDKTFLVTGAGGGIGGELVLSLLSRGARVAAVDLRDEPLAALATKANVGDRLSLHALDITDKDAVSTLPDAVASAHGAIDGVINCAGIVQPFIKVNDLDYEDIERVMNVNFYGLLHMTKTFLPHLLERPEASLINFSSMGGFLPVPGQTVYGASKAAVKLLTEGIYAELLDTSVHVSIVFPGATSTDITKNSGVAAPSVSDEKAKSFPMLSAHEAAEIVVRGIESDKPQIFTGNDSKFMNRLYRLNAVYATKFIAKKMKSLLG